MGGDFAPKATISGALLALQELDGAHTVQLVGQTSVIESQLDGQLSGEHKAAASARKRIEVVEAPDVIEMSEKPTAGLRKKPNSSMIVGLRLQTEGKSDAFVSAGNTGAQMASSAMLLKLQPGLTRPAIATVFPTARNPVIVIDSGANVDCSSKELLQFAWIGADSVKAALKGFDSTAYGGAPLLGCRGVSIICHGNSPPRAIKNAIKVAVRAVETRMNDQIGRKLEAAEPLINAVAESA